MLRLLGIAVATSLVTMVTTASTTAAGPAYTDPAKADADFAIQGEYAGMLKTDSGEARVGVQVIALGKGKFRAVAYHGGLPGDGWNGEAKVTADGQRESNGVAVFHGDHGTGRIEKGVLTVTNPDGQEIARLERVARRSPTLGADWPKGAIVLFDGHNTDAWENGRMTKDGLLEQGTTSKKKFGDHKVHVEFMIPYQPEDDNQERGNSGVYLQGRYEVQILDSFGLEGKQNECGGIYSVKDPDVNMCFPPLTWQTYDIDFKAARYDDQGKVIAAPRITVRHNGVLIHNNVELPADRSTTAAPVPPGREPGPLYLQDHGHPVRFRNVWVVETD